VSPSSPRQTIQETPFGELARELENAIDTFEVLGSTAFEAGAFEVARTASMVVMFLRREYKGRPREEVVVPALEAAPPPPKRERKPRKPREPKAAKPDGVRCVGCGHVNPASPTGVTTCAGCGRESAHIVGPMSDEELDRATAPS